MTIKHLSWLGLVSCLIFVSMPSAAAPPGFYIGGGGGISAIGDWLSGDEDAAWKVFGGYQFSPYFGIEAGYHRLGNFQFHKAFTGTEVRVDSDAAVLFATLGAPLSKHAAIFVKLGGVSWDADVETRSPSGSTSSGDNGVDFAWGVGGQYRFDERFSTRLELEGFDSGGAVGTVLALSAELLWHF